MAVPPADDPPAAAAPDPAPEPAAGASPQEATYQSLYRRYRPARFGDVLGQDHVTLALRNAVREGRASHGYLFSGPRGTGKTSTARILARALNCEKLDDGEPCGVCDSCTAITAQTSFAVIELDAASNNGVEAMRDLVSRASLGTTGLRKVYIIDEVHMLTTGAANTLLKTLEEPPGHVVFVLATTDPQKVLPTIESRVQHFRFHLLDADTLGDLVRSVNADAGLGLPEADLDRVVRRGAGSARDALSVLDQAAALGSAEEDVPVAHEVLQALVDRDPARALVAVARGCAAGRDPRRLAEEILAALRDAFLAGRAPTLVDLPPAETERVAEQGRKLGPAALVRAMETMGEALAEMREALDPRVSLEVGLVRVTAPEADASPGAMLERLERLERRMAGPESVLSWPTPSVAVPPVASPALPSGLSTPGSGAPAPDTAVRTGREAGGRAPAPPAQVAGATTDVGVGGGASVSRAPVRPSPGGGRALGSYRGGSRPAPAGSEPTSASAPATEPAGTPPTGTPPARTSPDRRPAASDAPPPPPASAAAANAPEGPFPTRDELTKAWGDSILGGLRGRAKAMFAVGRFVAVEDGVVVFALPNAAHREQCLAGQPEVEQALAAHFGRPVRLRLVADPGPAGPVAEPMGEPPPEEQSFSRSELRDAPPSVADSPADRVKSAFPGATEVES